MNFEDEDLEESMSFNDMVEVYADSVVLHFPWGDSISVSDKNLDYLFNHPDYVVDLLKDTEKSTFWNTFLPEAIRCRNRKRELYKDLGFRVG